MNWVMAVLSIIGTVANIYKKSWCFIVWAITNIFWFGWDMYHGLYAQASIFLVYFCLAIFGLVKWRREGRKRIQCPNCRRDAHLIHNKVDCPKCGTYRTLEKIARNL